MAMLAETAAFVETFCLQQRIARDDALRLSLIVEELFTNTIAHGFGGESDAPVSIALSRQDDRVFLRYEDDAPSYDPTPSMQVAPPSLNAPLEERPPGGLGLHLIARLTVSVRYAREGERNQLTIEFALQADAP